MLAGPLAQIDGTLSIDMVAGFIAGALTVMMNACLSSQLLLISLNESIFTILDAKKVEIPDSNTCYKRKSVFDSGFAIGRVKR